MLSDVLVPGKSSVRSIRSLWQMKEDWALFFRGKLNLWSMLNGYVPFNDTVELRVFDKGGRVKAVRYSHNIRTTQGRDQWQRLAMFGNITSNATGFTSVTGTASSAPTSTSLTNSSASFPTTGGPNVSLQGQIVVCPVAGVYGVIMSNTSTRGRTDFRVNLSPPSPERDAEIGAA